MKAVQIAGPKKLNIVEIEKPSKVGDNEVMIRVRMVGICGSDMHIYHGSNPFATYPRIFGHEFTGEVVEIGKDVKGLSVGDKTVVEPIQYCGKCYACRTGHGNVCSELKVCGVHMDGGAQEYVVLPEKMVHKVSSDLKWDEAVLIEPFTIGAQVNWHGDVKEGDVVLILGAGTIGLCILQIAKIRGAKCIVTDIVDKKLDYAKSMGADYVLNSLNVNVDEEVKRITEGMGPNVSVDTVCSTKTFEQVVNITSAAGRVVVIGFTEAPSQVAQISITKKELAVVGSRLQTNKFPEVIKLFNEKKVNIDTFVTQRYPMEKAQEAFQFYEEHPNDVRKIVLEF